MLHIHNGDNLCYAIVYYVIIFTLMLNSNFCCKEGNASCIREGSIELTCHPPYSRKWTYPRRRCIPRCLLLTQWLALPSHCICGQHFTSDRFSPPLFPPLLLPLSFSHPSPSSPPPLFLSLLPSFPTLIMFHHQEPNPVAAIDPGSLFSQLACKDPIRQGAGQGTSDISPANEQA